MNLINTRWGRQTVTKGLDWLYKQGVSSVLLFAILTAIMVQGPRVIDRVDRTVTKQTETIVKAFERDQERDERDKERLEAAREKDREAHRQDMEAITRRLRGDVVSKP